MITQLGYDKYRIHVPGWEQTVVDSHSLDKIYYETMIYDGRSEGQYVNLLRDSNYVQKFMRSYESLFGTPSTQYHIDGSALILGRLYICSLDDYYSIMKKMLRNKSYRFPAYSTIPLDHYPYLAELLVSGVDREKIRPVKL